MPVTTTYPGVYIEEVSSGVRTITGVATSITAFVGRTLRGPTDASGPVFITSYGGFERTFGGLWEKSPLSFAVRDFYLNGGSQAVIVRLFHPTFADDAERTVALNAAKSVSDAAAAAAASSTPAEVATAARTTATSLSATPGPGATAANTVATAAETAAKLPKADGPSVKAAAAAAVGVAAPITRAKLAVGALNLEAANPGAWGNGLRARVDHNVLLATGTQFNLTVRDGASGVTETFRNVSVLPNDVRNLVHVLEQESALVRVAGPLPSDRPDASAEVSPGDNPFDDGHSKGVTDPASDGSDPVEDDYTKGQANKTGLYALDRVDLFNLLCIPPFSFQTDASKPVLTTAAQYCETRRAMLLVDAPSAWINVAAAVGDGENTGIAALLDTKSKNAAVFFPRLVQPNPVHGGRMETFAATGAVAGVCARTDAQRGVWKAPAGLDATLVGVPQLSVPLTDLENGRLNPLGINCLRAMPAAGRVVWGARTLQGDDRLASEWKYIPVRRTALFLEESLYRGTQWVVFEPNDEPLWAQIRLNIGAFMQSLFRQGAFQGKTPREAYLVKCDRETTTQDDINRGVVNILVGFAPLKPAEFVVIRIQQLAGQIDT